MPFIPNPDPEKNKYKPPCTSPEHNPPGMIVLPPGEHVWQCPSCGEITKFTVSGVTC
jgi:hypothetical protein